MVYFKVTDGIETRKFQVTPGELTFEQLKERVTTLFQKALKETSDLVLKYRDAEGDLITLSSDEEFQDVLSDLPKDHVWKLHISSPSVKRAARPLHSVSFLDHILEPSWQPFGLSFNLWSGFDKKVQETQELINLLSVLHNHASEDKESKPSPSEENSTVPSTSEDKESKQSPSEENSTVPSTSEEKGQEVSEGSSTNTEGEVKSEEGDGEEVKSKISANSDKQSASASPSSSCPAHHRCHVKTFGSWEPVILGGPFGPRRIIGPVGYHITWTPKSQECCNSAATA